MSLPHGGTYLEYVCRRLLGPPAKAGGRAGESYWCCPFHDDGTPSMRIYRDHYHCFGCGAHGDHVTWLIEVEGFSREVAIETLMHWAGPVSHARRIDDPATLFNHAMRLWDTAVPITGTLATRYFTDRRYIDLGALPARHDDALRFHPCCTFNGSRLPCLLALFRDIESDAPAGIHRIALTLDGEKIERRMLGRWPRPRAIKIWQAGASLTIGEGLETALAAATRIDHRGASLHPAWAIGSSSGIARFPIVPGVERLIILVDNDSNGVGRDNARACAARWVAAGRKVVLLTTQKNGTDFNDLAASTHHEMHAH